ncbi:dimethylamine monooxygenase subunit DmmA family protein [Geodermatophilus sp. SYSU D00742]
MTTLLPPARQTSVPTWPDAPPPLDLTGRSFLVVQLGPGSADVADGWLRQAGDAGRPAQLWLLDGWAAGRADDLEQRLGTLRVGSRLAVAGPEADVLLLTAQARSLGLVPEEITAFAVGRDRISVFCVHCEATSRLAAAAGDEVTCPGCRRRLEVHEHVSGHRGSYLASAIAAPGGHG